MNVIIRLGDIDLDLIKDVFNDVRTSEIIITDERIEHIKHRHPEDYMLFEEYKEVAIANPDIIINDSKNKGSILVIKKLEETNLNIVVRLNLSTDNPNYKNSIMTFYRVRDKNLKKLMQKNIVIYKRQD